MVDDAARFSVELAEGAWAVGAKGNGGCFVRWFARRRLAAAVQASASA